jgi:hypothetical protein
MRIIMLTQELVKELFDYHEDGYLIWKQDQCNGKCKKGTRAGTKIPQGAGYYRVFVDGKLRKVSRIIFLWHKGYLPEGLVDHEDRNKANDRIGNLREIATQCNLRNCKVRSTNKTGVTGVSFTKEGTYKAGIKVNYRNINIGYYTNMDDAVMARHKKEIEFQWKGCDSTSSAYLYLVNKRLILRKRLV